MGFIVMSPAFFGSSVPKAILLSCFLLIGAGPVWSDSAPEFSLPDSTGKTVALDDFKGKPLVLHFWASWCPYCKKVQPGLENLVIENAEHNLVLLGINFREDDGVNPQEVLSKRGHIFKTLVQGDDVARSYGVKGTPTTFLLIEVGN